LGTQTISLPGDVLFDFNKDNLRSEATDLLKQVAGLLKAMPSGQIQVAGHTDNIGSDQYNLDLSLRRADAVEKYLKEVLPNNGGKFRWTSIGYGATSPIADNSTDEGRQRNRRVDLIVTP
jgi:outer membrane protein OmpA-like peptidoglycan-associated protein